MCLGAIHQMLEDYVKILKFLFTLDGGGASGKVAIMSALDVCRVPASTMVDP